MFRLEVRHQITETYVFVICGKRCGGFTCSLLSLRSLAFYALAFTFVCNRPGKWVDSPPDYVPLEWS